MQWIEMKKYKNKYKNDWEIKVQASNLRMNGHKTRCSRGDRGLIYLVTWSSLQGIPGCEMGRETPHPPQPGRAVLHQRRALILCGRPVPASAAPPQLSHKEEDRMESVPAPPPTPRHCPALSSSSPTSYSIHEPWRSCLHPNPLPLLYTLSPESCS